MQSSNCQSRAVAAVHKIVWVQSKQVTMLSLVTVAAIFLACLPPETVSQQCRSGVTDEIRQSVREQLRQGGGNGTIPTVAVNCGQVRLVVMHEHAALQSMVGIMYYKMCMSTLHCKVYDRFHASEYFSWAHHMSDLLLFNLQTSKLDVTGRERLFSALIKTTLVNGPSCSASRQVLIKT